MLFLTPHRFAMKVIMNAMLKVKYAPRITLA